jgi:hypothetical protein
VSGRLTCIACGHHRQSAAKTGRACCGRWQSIDRLVIAGRGLAYAAALEIALKVKETTGILAEGLSTADLRHGPIATAFGGAPVLLVDAGGPAASDTSSLGELRAGDLRVQPPRRAPQPGRGPVPRRRHPRRHHRAGLGELAVMQHLGPVHWPPPSPSRAGAVIYLKLPAVHILASASAIRIPPIGTRRTWEPG